MFNASFISATGKEITVLGLEAMPRFDIKYIIRKDLYVLTGVEKADSRQCLEKYPSGFAIRQKAIFPMDGPLAWSFDSGIVSWAAASAYKLEESWTISVTENGEFVTDHSDEVIRDMRTMVKPFPCLASAKAHCQSEETRFINRLLGRS